MLLVSSFVFRTNTAFMDDDDDDEEEEAVDAHDRKRSMEPATSMGGPGEGRAKRAKVPMDITDPVLREAFVRAMSVRMVPRCMCDVDMAIVDAAKKEYRLADPARRVQLDALNQLAQGTASEEAGTSSGSSASSSSSSKKKRSRTTTENEAAGADPVLTQVARADGKRKATQSTR